MNITEVRIKLMDSSQERLLAFCSITIDGCFVVRDLKVIQGTKGPFVAMPSRKLADRCPTCGNKNCLRANFCGCCGKKLEQERAPKGGDGRAKLYADIAHPINTDCRELIQEHVLRALEEERILSKEPGYQCRYDDFGDAYESDDDSHWDHEPRETNGAQPATLKREQPTLPVDPPGTTRRVDAAQTTQPAAPPHKSRTATPAPSGDHEADDFGGDIL